MTAVLLTILKIIGIVLLVILGIMLFLLAVLLFVPVRYSVKGTVDNNITAEGKISWLCSIFRYDFTFQEQELNGEVRIFGFRPKKKERISEEELEEEAVPEVKDGVEEVVSDLVSAAGEEDKSEKTPISGKKEVLSVKLAEEVVDPDDIEMLQDLIVAATNEALRTMEEESQAAMSKLTGGLGGLGGGFPF